MTGTCEKGAVSPLSLTIMVLETTDGKVPAINATFFSSRIQQSSVQANTSMLEQAHAQDGEAAVTHTTQPLKLAYWL